MVILSKKTNNKRKGDSGWPILIKLYLVVWTSIYSLRDESWCFNGKPIDERRTLAFTQVNKPEAKEMQLYYSPACRRYNSHTIGIIAKSNV